MSKKELNAFKRELRAKVCPILSAYMDWKSKLQQAPDGFLGKCENNFQMLAKLIPDEAQGYFESPENNPLIDFSHDYSMEEMHNRIQIMVNDMLKYVPDFLENLKNRFAGDDSQLTFMYYWLLLDNGAIELKRLFCEHYCPHSLGVFGKPIFKILVGAMVTQSINSFITSKKEWQKEEKESMDEDVKALVAASLTTVNSCNKGREDRDMSLSDLLMGKKSALLDEVKSLVQHRKSDTELGGLLYALEKAHCIIPCQYTTFHRALKREFPDYHIGGYDRPQQIYGKLKSGLVDELKERQKKSIKESYNSFFAVLVEVNC